MSRFAVNGKEPIAVWCPSRDDSGNGTTTLNDLVGSSHGTLTNFALSGSTSNWVADTSNGGIRALDIDGVNDFVNVGNWEWFGSGAWSASLWFLSRSVNDYQVLIGKDTIGKRDFLIGVSSSTSGRISFGDFVTAVTSPTALTNNTWYHVVVTKSVGGSLSVYVNGGSPTTGSTRDFTGQSKVYLGAREYPGFPNPLNGRLDDVRIFSTAINASDVSQLFIGGRGKVAPSSNNGILAGVAF